MAQTPANIHVGPLRLFVGITNPVTGVPPTLMAHTNGVPGTGTEVGYTEGDGIIEYLLTKTPIQAEQALADVDAFPSAEMIKLTVMLQESVYIGLKSAFDSSIGNVDDGSKTLFYSGGTVPTPVMLTPIMFSSPRRDNPAKYFIGVIYKAYAPKGFVFPFSKTKKAVYPLELQGVLDTTRNAGDQLFQMFREK